MSERLIDIISQAYSLFSKYKVHDSLMVCKHCCVTDKEEHLLISTPLKQLSSELLSVYNTSAHIENSSSEEYKYFFPRILELITQFDFPTHSSEVTFTRMNLQGFDKWKINDWLPEERELFNEFAIEFFRDSFTTEVDNMENNTISFLIMFGLTGYDISPLLTEWQNNININATIKFSKFITWELDDKKDRLITSFKTDELSEKIINWAFSEPVKGHFKKQIENILFQLNIKLDEHIKNEMIWTYDSIK